MRRNSPPVFACRLVESVLPSRYPEAMLGDLIEEYSFALNLRRDPPLRAGFGAKPAVLSRSSLDRHCELEIGLSVRVPLRAYTLSWEC
jgi:hypothetical protein